MTVSPAIDLDRIRIDPAWAMRIPVSLAVRKRLLPIAVIGGKLHVACANPDDTASIAAVERFTGMPVAPISVDQETMVRVLARVYGETRTAESAAIASEGDDATRLAEELMRAAIMRRASDIHLDPGRDDIRVRLRVDGGLEEYRRIPITAHAALTSRIKVLAGMDIAERRAPQDGAFIHAWQIAERSHAVDVRVASLPTKHGERMTLRLLASKDDWLSLEQLGMSANDLAAFESALDRPHGLILLTGPTGGGKTTTLYAAVRKLLAARPLNVISVEDPVECEIPGMAQVEVDSADKVSFSKALRSLLRHDPDVLVIGEIRDEVSLDIAVKASLTGHLVFSTLHTNHAVSAITRLTDMGMPAHLVAATLRLCVGQRLVRRLCPHCRREVPVDDGLLAMMDLTTPPAATYGPGECFHCAGRGYDGRMGLFECAAINAGTASLIARGATEQAIAESLADRGFRTLQQDGLTKVAEGATTLREVFAATTGF
jgi:general secretion pathway protein E